MPNTKAAPTSTESTPAQAIDELLPTVRYWARHYGHKAHQVLEMEDLVVAGLVGLMDAASRYSPQHNTTFRTYAEFRIRGEIVDELRRQDWMSRGERRKQKQYREAVAHLGQELKRSPTRGELAKVLPFKADELDRVAQYEQKDLLRPYLEGDQAGEENEDLVAEGAELRDEVCCLLSRLPPLLRAILEQRYYEEASLATIGKRLGLSEGRISQLHAEALAFLRSEAA